MTDNISHNCSPYRNTTLCQLTHIMNSELIIVHSRRHNKSIIDFTHISGLSMLICPISHPFKDNESMKCHICQ